MCGKECSPAPAALENKGGETSRRETEREGGRLRGQIRKWSSHNNTVSPVTQFQVKPRCMKNFVEVVEKKNIELFA